MDTSRVDGVKGRRGRAERRHEVPAHEAVPDGAGRPQARGREGRLGVGDDWFLWERAGSLGLDDFDPVFRALS